MAAGGFVPGGTATIAGEGLSFEPIVARQMWLPIRAGDVRRVWNFQIQTLDSQHWFDFTVDVETGKVWTRIDWIASDNFRVYEVPVESPNHTSPLPPSDARTLVVNPEDATASPSDGRQQRPRLPRHQRQQRL